MVASSYPRFPGDSVGGFMEPIAQGVAARGHEVHVVAPWHPKWNRPQVERGVHFHLFHYAPVEGLNTFGYAEGMRADVRLRASAIAIAPVAVLAGWFKALRVAQKKRATIVHAHWVIPGGVIGAAAAGLFRWSSAFTGLTSSSLSATESRVWRRAVHSAARAGSPPAARIFALAPRPWAPTPHVRMSSPTAWTASVSGLVPICAHGGVHCSASRIMYRWSWRSDASSRKRDLSI